ncbi:unnamed protein product [Nezara viridula]|uniref:Uncharacterized protein n=1 Tax=Nezara viridula TaxID=85310 RepID=A0A9P0MWP9_NEZVI|nr:unnamed protein product [Nezara viridula]
MISLRTNPVCRGRKQVLLGVSSSPFKTFFFSTGRPSILINQRTRIGGLLKGSLPQRDEGVCNTGNLRFEVPLRTPEGSRFLLPGCGAMSRKPDFSQPDRYRSTSYHIAYTHNILLHSNQVPEHEDDGVTKDVNGLAGDWMLQLFIASCYRTVFFSSGSKRIHYLC